MTLNHAITRRSALQGIAAWAGVARFAHAAEPSTGGRFVEKQPTGAEIWQVTTEEFDQSDIYGEVPYCSRDSRYFVYARRNPALKTNRTEFMLVELGSWKQQRLDTAISISGCAISHDGKFYYLKQADDGSTDLMRADLDNGKATAVYRLPPGLAIRSLGTVTTDGRYYAGGTMTEPGWKMFDITLIDLQKGEHRILDRDPFILNPHPQFEPGEGRTLMIQHNRGGKYSPDGQLERLVGPEGATLYVLSVPEGRRTNWQSARRTLLPAPATKPGSGPRAKCCCPCRPAASSVPRRATCWRCVPGSRPASLPAATASTTSAPAAVGGFSRPTTGNRRTRSSSAARRRNARP